MWNEKCIFPFINCTQFKFCYNYNNGNLGTDINKNNFEDIIIKNISFQKILENNDDKTKEEENEIKKILNSIKKEIYDTEKKYIKGLKIFRDVYIIPLREHDHLRHNNNNKKEIIDQLLGSIYNIEACNKIFLKNLEEKININTIISDFGFLFWQHF